MPENRQQNTPMQSTAYAGAAEAKAEAGAKSTLATTTLVSRELAKRNETGRERRSRPDRFDADDFHGRDAEPDLGVEDGDDPWVEDGEWDRLRVIGKQPEIYLWKADDSVEYEVRTVGSDVLADPRLAPQALKRARRLDVYAQTLAAKLRWAHIDGSLAVLWDSMPVLTQAEFALELERSGAQVGEKLTFDTVSRDRDVLIALPGVTVALGLLMSKSSNDLAVRMIARLLRDDPTVSRGELDRKVAGAGLGARRAEQYLGWVQLALAHPSVAAQYRSALLASPHRYDSLLDDYAETLHAAPAVEVLGRQLYAPYPGRGDAPLMRALVGGF